jgi:hypothetical protein
VILRVKTPENVLVTGPDGRGQVGTEFNPLVFIRGDEPVDLQFLQDVDGVETPYRLAVATPITLGFKRSGVFEGDWLIDTTDFTRPGADDGVYTATMDCDSAEAQDLLNTPDGNTANDVGSASIAGELSWLLSGATSRQRTRRIYATLLNTYTQGDEGDATTANARTTVLRTPAGAAVAFSASANTDAARGAALVAARSAAASGDLIEVFPGGYAITASLAKAGVNWHFHAGAIVTYASDSAGGTWSDGGTSMSFSVTGDGDFIRTATDSGSTQIDIVSVTHASSVISISARDLSTDHESDSVAGNCVYQSAGKLYVRARKISAVGLSASATGVWWLNGEMHVHAERIECTSAGGGQAVYGTCNATPTGDAYITADEITSSIYAIYSNGSNTAAAMWVRALIVRGTASLPTAIQNAGSNRLYVETEKVFGQIGTSASSGLLYVRAQKQSALANGSSGAPSLIYIANGTARIAIDHYDPVSFTGESIKVTGGTLELLGGGFVGIASGKGFEITGGTARLQGLRVDTAANSSSNPVTKSGGTLILDGCTLVAEGASDSIAAGSAQNVKVYNGTVTNRAKNANVTIQVGTLTVDSNVS